ncbi:MAG: spermidine/putrescine ABC transporter substrate-binding protein [Deltaproteobacteria bacterium]|nr:spermidine/putrescine ABC transporter substrate-binding protein [Nannocystaceae bacterium]
MLGGLAGALLLPGCAKPRAKLALYNWGDYLARSVIDGFALREQGAGRPLDITEDFYLSEAEMAAKLRAWAPYDVVFPIDYLVDQLVHAGSLRELHLASLPHAEHLDVRFGPYIAKDDRIYAIPYLWGTTGIGYDSEKVDAPTSWQALFDPRWSGRISVIDSKGDVMDQALLAAGMSINSNDKQLIKDEVWPRLLAQKELLRAYDSNPARALVRGETWIAQIDSGDLLRAQEEKPSLRYVIPEEGAAVWTDYLAIPAAAAAAEIGLRFIDYLLEPEIAAANANELHFATPNRTALDRGLIDAKDNPQIYPPEELMKKLQKSDNWLGGTGELVDEIWLDLRGG